MGREGKTTWSNDTAIVNIWSEWAVRPFAHRSYDAIFGMIMII